MTLITPATVTATAISIIGPGTAPVPGLSPPQGEAKKRDTAHDAKHLERMRSRASNNLVEPCHGIGLAGESGE